MRQETLFRPLPRAFKSKSPPVTILVGFTTDVAVILASDSQVTYHTQGAKDMEAKKIVTVTMSNRKVALIAKSGVMETAHAFHDGFEALVSKATINTAQDIADMARSVMMRVHRHLTEPLREGRASENEIRQQIADHWCECLFGFVHDGKPHLYSITLDSFLAIQVRPPFYVTGSGANLARSILSGFDLTTMSPDKALAVGTYAIEISKKFDEFCSGRIQIGIALSRGNLAHTQIISPEFTERYRQVCEATYEENKAALPEILGKKINAALPLSGVDRTIS